MSDSEAAPPMALKSGKPGQGTDWWAEAKSIFWLVLAVLGFHSFIAKPFYIPSESMMPILLKGDRLVVTKFPYGWSYVSPSFHILPFIPGRLLGRLPERGDIVIVKPLDQSADYIKRVIALPGDTLEMRGGVVILNDVPLKREARPPIYIPVDANAPCEPEKFPGARMPGPDGGTVCKLPVFRETLPGGRYYDTIDLGPTPQDDYPRTRIPEGHIFLMGDNRDQSADSRVPMSGLGLGGALPWENLGGRAEFITFSFDGTTRLLNPITWFTSLRGSRAGTSLRPDEQPAP